MTAKETSRKAGETEDFLGLVTFGSLIANIVQIVRGKTLENKHEVLKKHALELGSRYRTVINRNKQISNAYLSLKKINEELTKQVHFIDDMANGLRIENTKLKEELDTIREKNLKLQVSKTGSPHKKRRISREE
jgi:hypothetical protein